MQIERVISGGQTGADQSGLLAARKFGIKTGGTAPPRFMTEDGPRGLLLRGFGLVEGEPDPKTYPGRTKRNVLDSDGTVIFCNVFSPGSLLTRRLCIKYTKPVIVNPSSMELVNWIKEKNIKILNVAGNRESKNPGIGVTVKAILEVTFNILLYPGDEESEDVLL